MSSDILARYRAARLLDRMRPVTASAIGDDDLPVADRDMPWDGDAAQDRVFEAATDSDGVVNPDLVARAFLYRDDEADPTTQSAYKLGFADVVDGELQIVPAGLAAAAAAMSGGRGQEPQVGDDGPAIISRINDLYDRVRDVYEDWPESPFERGDDDE